MANYFQDDNPDRHKLVRPLDASKVVQLEAVGVRTAMSAISTAQQLRGALIEALKLELATIPPYMCGLYTIRDETNVEAARLIRSVVVEEMLHMVLVINVLNAISTREQVAELLGPETLVLRYPAKLPAGIEPKMPDGRPFEIQLLPFSCAAIDEFTTIERPADPDEPLPTEGYESIGQFYQCIRWALKLLSESGEVVFNEESDRQITEEHYYGSGGKIIAVDSYDAARRAIDEIVGQGEGIDGKIQAPDSTLFGEGIEYAHYFRFREIHFGRFYKENDTNQQAPVQSVPTGVAFEVSYSSAHAMRPNPKIADYHDPALVQMAESFNRLYGGLVTNILLAASGNPAKLTTAVVLMHDLREMAKALMNVPLDDGTFAGPTFEHTP